MGSDNGSKPKVVSLFSGIGGFDLGFDKAGFELAFQCENDEFCLSVLRKHWPGVKRAKDIRSLHGSDIPEADAWAAGFPCQDVSVARMGPRAGIRGSQSSLFFEFARLVGEKRPRVFLLENVHGLLSSHGGRDFAVVLQTLAELGYGLGWRVLNSRYFGVPQSRKRVYIVGCDSDPEGPARILLDSKRRSRHAPARRQDGSPSLSPFKAVVNHLGRQGPVTPSIAYCLYAESARHTGTDWSRNYVSYPESGEVRRLTPDESEGVMAFPKGWTYVNGNGPKCEDPDSPRYHALGNAVTPPVAEWFAVRIRQYLEVPKMEKKSRLDAWAVEADPLTTS